MAGARGGEPRSGVRFPGAPILQPDTVRWAISVRVLSRGGIAGNCDIAICYI